MVSNLKGIQVPFTRCEWDIVTSVYRSDEASELKKAVALIVSWKARLGESVHVAADMTEMLLRAIIMDKETKDDDWFRIGNVRLAYCTAIIRFVNYVNEICQSDHHFRSIASAVSNVGIPEWIVDIRHGATHSHLPSLQSLREAAQYCRNWLWENHWSRPVAEAIGLNLNLSEDNDESVLQRKAANLIDLFMMYSLKKKSDKRSTSNKLHNVLTDMETFIMMHPREFLGAFLLEGYLIMDKKQVKSIGCNLFAEDEDVWIIPEDLQLFWRPIFHFLNQAKILPELLFQLLEMLSDSEVQQFQERQLVAWIDKMISAYVGSSVLTQAEWERMLKTMMMSPGKLKEIHFDSVLNKMEKITGKKQAALRQLATLSTEGPSASVVPTSSYNNGESFKTVEDLRKLMSERKDEKQPKTGEDSSIADSSSSGRWTACDPLEWKNIPLGLTPEQSAESLYLVVEPEVPRVRKRHQNSEDSSTSES